MPPFATKIDSPGNRILVLSTAGGKTNALPVLEIARLLHARGYSIEYGTLDTQGAWAARFEFISKVHILGRGASLEEEEQNYLRMTDWHIRSIFDDWSPVFEAKKFLEMTWPSVFSGLVQIMEDPHRRPDFILADYLVESARDISHIYGIPIATHWPQMPTAMLKNNYTPGIPGLSVDIISSEHATFWQRLKNELMLIRVISPLIRYKKWRKRQRSAAGLTFDLPATNKPNHLLLVNTYFGLTPAIDTPPNVVAIGPILGDTFNKIERASPLEDFMLSHDRILYISMGTHALLNNNSITQILTGACQSLNRGDINGIVWSIRGMALAQVQLSLAAPDEVQKSGRTSSLVSMEEIFNNAHPHIFVTDFAPQRAILSHAHTRLFITHGGASSTNEACYHGVPVICLGIYFDQLQNSMRLRDSGLGISLDHHSMKGEDLATAIRKIMLDSTGEYRRNADRMSKIARIASRRKSLAADMIEEALYDHQGRTVNLPDRPISFTRPSHLQTADMRMSWWKRNNVDLKFLTALVFLCQGWVSVKILTTVGILDSRWLW